MLGYQHRTYKYGYELEHKFFWVNSPKCNFTDVIGISVGNNMKINSGSYSGQTAFSYDVHDPTSPTGQKNITNVKNLSNFTHNNLGLASNYDLLFGGENFGYIRCTAKFTLQKNGQSANSFGNYIHAQFGLGNSISIDINGVPSISLSIIDKAYSVPMDIWY